ELVGGAVETGGAALGDDVDLGAAGAAAVRGVEAAFHLELRNRVDARERHQRQVAAAVHVVGAIHRPIVGGAAIAADRVRKHGGGPSGRRVADIEIVRSARREAGHQRDELFVVARAERKFAHLAAFNGAGGGDGAKFHLDRVGLYFNALGGGADLQREVDLQIVIDVEDDIRPVFGLEPRSFDFDRVISDRK